VGLDVIVGSYVGVLQRLTAALLMAGSLMAGLLKG